MISPATAVILAGQTVVVAGYGWCGRGGASRMKGMGANVIVVEIDGTLGPHESGLQRGLSALYDGFRVMPMPDAAKQGDIFVTATGNKAVIGKEHFPLMKNGAILCNTGHFNVEIDEPALRTHSLRVFDVKENVVGYEQKGGRIIYLLSEGRLVNLSQPSGQGHPIEIMDGSFALQALCCELMAKSSKAKRGKMKPGVHSVPKDVDDEVARMLLSAKGVRLEKPTKEQVEYSKSFEEGTQYSVLHFTMNSLPICFFVICCPSTYSMYSKPSDL